MIFAFALLSVTWLFAQDKETVFSEIKEKFSKINSLSFSFADVNNKNNSGTILAAKGNKYKLSAGDRIIYCDGKKISNLSITENKAMISNYDDDNSSYSIEGFFFNSIEHLKPISFVKEQSTKQTNGLFVLTLQADENYAKQNKIKDIKIWLDKNNNIKFLSFNQNNKTLFYEIKNFKINPKIKDSDFKPKFPKNCQIIELD